jgi:hypothetical protein
MTPDRRVGIVAGMTTTEYRAAARADRWASLAFWLALASVAVALTFFWFFGIPPAIVAGLSLFYGWKARNEGTAKHTQLRWAGGLVAAAAVITVLLIAVNIHHLY